MDDRPHIFGVDRTHFRELTTQWGWPGYRADQVMDWIYRQRVLDPQQMTNLSQSDRQRLARQFRFATGRVATHQIASDNVQKLLIDWSDSQLPDSGHSASALRTECVLIPTPDRQTACISSQIGCPVGCTFCASGLDGLQGNLSAGQMVEQVWQLTQILGTDRITHVVFMGMGEPLANFDPVVAATGILMADWGMNISGRRITISTVGLPSQIMRLADLRFPVTLAISLHAPNDELRRSLIPWANYVGIDQLVEAGRYYFDKTGREITLEYILLRQINDRPNHARELTHLARRLRSNVNLIRYNEVKGIPYGRPSGDDVHQFQAILRNAGINCHIRASRGRDIAAACGQLRRAQKV